MIGFAVASVLLTLVPEYIEGLHTPLLHRRQLLQRDFITRLHETIQKEDSTSTVPSVDTGDSTQTRPLGSQELLMLPRQYGPHLEKPTTKPFPQMSHVSTALYLPHHPQKFYLSPSMKLWLPILY